MKKIRMLFLMMNLLISVNLFGQPYESVFGINSTEWDIACWGFTTYETFTFSVCCDTTINARSYKKFILINDTGCLTPYRCYFLSEDTLNGKLWLYNSEDEKEYLSMDLNLNIGDTFKINPKAFHYNPPSPPETDSIAIVDSVFFKNGRKMIRINIHNFLPANQEKLTFIEGVGPNFGVFYQAGRSVAIYDQPRQLLCAKKDSVYVYKNKINLSTWPDTCLYVQVGINEFNKNAQIEIFPNPVKEELNLIFPEPFEGYIIVYNVLGSVEEQIYLKNILNYKMETSTLNKNVYFIRVLNKDVSVTKKIIKY